MIYVNRELDTIYIELNEALDPESNYIGESWKDYKSGAWVLLSDEQIAFHKEHPEANIEEVFNMQLTPNLEPTPAEKLEQARKEKIQAIYNQDRSTELFTVNGIPMWLDKSTRTSLVANTLLAEKAAGKTETTLWYTGQPPVSISVPISWLEERLAELELYAKATYDTTQSHLAAVYSLTTVEEIEAYDITTGYPEQLTFVLEGGVK